MQSESWFRATMVSGVHAIADVRARFERWLGDRAVDADTREDLTVVLSELCANAVGAAESSKEQIRVRAWQEGTGLVLEVENPRASRAGGVTFHHDGDPLRGYGQGLLIVSAYTDSVEVVPPREDAGLLVRCRKSVPGI